MDAVTADQVLQVLQVLYAGTATDNAGRKEADTWLNDFQKTPNAWAISDQLLRTETLPQEARLFAAQTLRQKVEFDFSQLEPSAQERLKESLIAFLHNYRAGPKSVLKQLSLSLADLAIQLSAWTDPVRELIAVFGKNAEMISPLLEFLIVLPEEFLENRRIRMDDEDLLIRANQVLRKNAQDILQLLIFYFTQSAADYELQERIFQCLFSWIYNGEIQPEAVLATPLFDHAFAALHVDELFESAVDVTCEILYRTRKNPSSHIIEMIYPRLVALRTLLNENLEDTDIIRGLCRIFADAGEAWVARIAESYDTYAVVIDGLLQCTACEDLEIVRISFNFWNALASEVIKPPNEAQRLKYVAVFQKLEDIMIAHLQYPDEAATWTAEERDEFREFRHTMGDVLKDCVRVIGAEEALNRPSSILSSFVVDPSTGAFDSSVQWQKIEAPLFALRAMCREVSTRESTVVPKIMAMLPHLPPHPKIKYAAILVIGRYAEWTAHHPDFIPYQLTFVSQGFENDPDTNAAAAQALKYLCKSCGKLLVNFLEQLHPFYLTTIKKISREDARDLTEAIAYVIAEVPSDNLLQTFQMFCAPVAQRLHEIAHQARPTGEAEEALIVEAADQLGYLALFIKYVRPSIPHDQPHPCASLVMQLWPILDALLSTYGNVEEIADACSRVCSHSMRSYGLHIAPILTPMMSKIVALFDATGLPCYLWVSKRCVEAYASDEKEEGKVIFSIVETLTASTFKRFSASQDKLDAIPDGKF
ncbi:armadillo-type protein [Gaertneriomyces semiglobifer]|nr:armadillo-type protein [Gaertneriomyces semiglobifer]